MKPAQWQLDTIALHSGYDAQQHQRSAAIPVYQTSSFTFDDAQYGAELFNLAREGYIYSRTGNPTLDILEKRVAALEGGIGAVAFSSGMAAIDAAVSTILRAGDHLVSSVEIYGGTHNFFHQTLVNRGISVSTFSLDDLESLHQAILPSTKIVFIESISNPSGRLADIAAIAKICETYGIVLIVDNTVASPLGLQPFQLGAHIIVHSLTKYIAGHGNVLGGIVVDSGRFPWAQQTQRYPHFSLPNASYHGVVFTETFGEAAYIASVRTGPLRSMGGVLSPHAAFLVLQGLETVSLRYQRIAENTTKIVQFLSQHPAVATVSHLSLAQHPDYSLAKKLLKIQGIPGILSFELKQGAKAAQHFYDHLQLFLRLVNIGDSKSLAAIPAQTTHRQLNEEDRIKAGISDGLVRLSIGIEHVDDLLADLEQALSF